MNKKILAFSLVAVLLLAFAGRLFVFNGDATAEVKKNPELDKYRSEDIPEACRLPVYEDNLDWWKQHLSHHQQTWDCLKYYGTSIEEMRGGN